MRTERRSIAGAPQCESSCALRCVPIRLGEGRGQPRPDTMAVAIAGSEWLRPNRKGDGMGPAIRPVRTGAESETGSVSRLTDEDGASRPQMSAASTAGIDAIGSPARNGDILAAARSCGPVAKAIGHAARYRPMRVRKGVAEGEGRSRKAGTRPVRPCGLGKAHRRDHRSPGLPAKAGGQTGHPGNRMVRSGST